METWPLLGVLRLGAAFKIEWLTNKSGVQPPHSKESQ